MNAKAARAQIDAFRAARGFLAETVGLEEFVSAVTRLEAEMEEHARVHAQDASSEQLADHLALQIAATRLAYPNCSSSLHMTRDWPRSRSRRTLCLFARGSIT